MSILQRINSSDLTPDEKQYLIDLYKQLTTDTITPHGKIDLDLYTKRVFSSSISSPFDTEIDE